MPRIEPNSTLIFNNNDNLNSNNENSIDNTKIDSKFSTPSVIEIGNEVRTDSILENNLSTTLEDINLTRKNGLIFIRSATSPDETQSNDEETTLSLDGSSVLFETVPTNTNELELTTISNTITKNNKLNITTINEELRVNVTLATTNSNELTTEEAINESTIETTTEAVELLKVEDEIDNVNNTNITENDQENNTKLNIENQSNNETTESLLNTAENNEPTLMSADHDESISIIENKFMENSEFSDASNNITDTINLLNLDITTTLPVELPSSDLDNVKLKSKLIQSNEEKLVTNKNITKSENILESTVADVEVTTLSQNFLEKLSSVERKPLSENTKIVNFETSENEILTTVDAVENKQIDKQIHTKIKNNELEKSNDNIVAESKNKTQSFNQGLFVIFITVIHLNFNFN